MTSAIPCRSARPDRGSTRPAQPSGIATAMPGAHRGPLPRPERGRLGRAQVVAGVVLVRARRERAASGEAREAQRSLGLVAVEREALEPRAPRRPAPARAPAPRRRCPRAPSRPPRRAARTAGRPRRRAPAAPSGAGVARKRASTASRSVVQPLARLGRHLDGVGEAERELAAALVVEQVHLVQREQARALGGADLGEHVLHGGEHLVQLLLRHRGVGHVQDQVGLQRLLERGAERLDELVRQLADEADGVGEQVRCARRSRTSGWSGSSVWKRRSRTPTSAPVSAFSSVDLPAFV